MQALRRIIANQLFRRDIEGVEFPDGHVISGGLFGPWVLRVRGTTTKDNVDRLFDISVDLPEQFLEPRELLSAP
jgi:hypothetical protein